MACRRVLLVIAMLAAASCAKEHAKSASPGNSPHDVESGRGDMSDNKPRAPGPTDGSASPTETSGDPREAARNSGMVGPSDERLGSDVKSGFDDEKKGKGATEGMNHAPQKIAAEPAKSPGVRIDIATLQGNPDPGLKSQIEAHLADVRACYDTARAKTPGLAGRIDLSFSVNGDGTVIAPMVANTSTVKDRTLGGCVVGIVAKLALAKVATPPIKGVLVFVFGA